MPPDTDPLEERPDDSAAYRWTVRALYCAALAMNAYVLWEASKDDAELAILRRKAEGLVHRVVAPIRRQREWRKKVAFVHWQAHEIVKESSSDAG